MKYSESLLQLSEGSGHRSSLPAPQGRMTPQGFWPVFCSRPVNDNDKMVYYCAKAWVGDKLNTSEQNDFNQFFGTVLNDDILDTYKSRGAAISGFLMVLILTLQGV